MKDQDLISIWKSTKKREYILVDPSLLMMGLKNRLTDFNRKIFYRDILEIGVAIIMIPILLIIAITIPAVLSKIGALILACWCLFIIFHLRKNKPKLDEENLALLDFLIHKKTVLVAQKNLLESVFYWYLLPFIIGVLLLVWGISVNSLKSSFYSIFIFGLTAVIYYINKRAARMDIMPLIREVDNLIEQFKK